ncbi:putative double-stranded RNA-specific adenosine deaminase [Apostichopus japonicus]|uniref:Putative double-stranded RNA-specific adenosine deaminase n=1 Tax=Stichopus japonicus TaxID=307972 RepID=A0A2G8KGC5_STIJA|nr:putative double-stranded RNA-specific adenosine deaminase [Apostichopus japonicus]
MDTCEVTCHWAQYITAADWKDCLWDRLSLTRGSPSSPRIGRRKFPPVVTQNKKDGRREAAEAAIRILAAEGAFQMSPGFAKSSEPGFGGSSFFDQIATLAHQTFNNFAVDIPECFSGKKVIAALIMKTDVNDIGRVIALGTGNRCVTGDKLSLEGQTVHDSHAEVVTRRAFMSPLCDGAQFSWTDNQGNEEGPQADLDFSGRAHHCPTQEKNIQGLLRTKMELGEGTIPIQEKHPIQTWDAILQNQQRLRTMSCSDKVCRWNILGLQGSLLSNFIEPVYLSSLTLGALYHHGHLARAVCCRMDHYLNSIDDANRCLASGLPNQPSPARSCDIT